MAVFREVRQVELSQLVVTNGQARRREVSADLGELINNLRVHGQLEPIVIAPIDGSGEEQYEIIAGQRRYLAAKQLGWPTILAGIFESSVDHATARALSISENMIRRDLTSKDLIDSCTDLYRRYGSIKSVSEELGLPYSKVRSYVKFDRLRPQLKAMVEAGDLDVRSSLRIEDHYGHREVLDEQIKDLAQQVMGMTNAQQVDFFKASKRSSEVVAVPSGAATVSGAEGARPGSVVQIVVTLRREDHEMLKRWAKGKGTGQDAAAREIISNFLRGLRREGGGIRG